MHNRSFFYGSHGSSFVDIKIPAMMYTVSGSCTKWSCSIWEMRRICWERALRDRKAKFGISRCEYDFYITEKLSQTKRRKTIIVLDNRACFECVSESFTCYIWECFSRRECSIDRHDIVHASISDNWHTTLTSEFPSHDFITIWFIQHWLCIGTYRCQLGPIGIIESQEYRCSIIEWCHSWEEYLYWRSFWSCYQFDCWLWDEDVGNCDEQCPDEQWRSNHRFMHLATAFQCTKKLFKSNIAPLFSLDYALFCLLRYFFLFYFCEEPVKNAFKTGFFY